MMDEEDKVSCNQLERERKRRLWLRWVAGEE
jgi:hypothetical protein